MERQTRTVNSVELPHTRDFKFFFLVPRGGDRLHLHKVLRRQIGRDHVVSYDFFDKEIRGYSWSLVRKQMQHAYTITQAAALLGRHRDSIINYIEQGAIEPPQREFSLNSGKLLRHFLSEDDVLDIHAYMQGIHAGRPRKDGDVTNNRLVPAQHVMSQIKIKQPLYILDSEGNPVPIWKE